MNLDEVFLVPPEAVPNGKNRLLAGEILFNNTNSDELVGKSALIQASMNAGFSNHMTRVVIKPQRAEPAFVAYSLDRLWASGHFRRICTRWVSQSAVNTKALADVKIALPPLPEQRRIVEILDRAASVRALRRQAQDTARQIIPALFNKMFGDPATNPMGWPVAPLGEVIAGFEGGKNLLAGAEAVNSGGLKILKVSAVTSGTFRPDEAKPAPVGYVPPDSHFVRDGDLLISRANTLELVGATALVRQRPANVLLPDKIWRVLFQDPSRVLPVFLHAWFKQTSIRAAMSRLASGTSASMRNISQGRLVTVPLILPPLSLQRAFTKQVSTIDRITGDQERSAAIAETVTVSIQTQLGGQ